MSQTSRHVQYLSRTLLHVVVLIIISVMAARLTVSRVAYALAQAKRQVEKSHQNRQRTLTTKHDMSYLPRGALNCAASTAARRPDNATMHTLPASDTFTTTREVGYAWRPLATIT